MVFKLIQNKMNILSFSKIFWEFIGGFYIEKSSTILSVFINCFHIISLQLFVYGSISNYYYEMDNLDPGQTIYNFLQIFPNIAFIVSYIFYCKRKRNLFNLIEKFQNAVNERYNHLTAHIYENAEQNAEFFSKWPFTFYCVTFDVGFIGATIVYLVLSMIKEEINVHEWPSMLHFRYARLILLYLFDYFSSNGYLYRLPYCPYASDDLKMHAVNCLIQMICATSHFAINTMCLSIFASFNFYMNAFCEDFCQLFDQLDDSLKLNRIENQIMKSKMLLTIFKLQQTIAE